MIYCLHSHKQKYMIPYKNPAHQDSFLAIRKTCTRTPLAQPYG